MVHVQDVARYILNRLGPMTAMKMQKLCYYSYGYHLAWEERQLFPEHFEAWANGPVCPALYNQHRGRFQLQPADIDGNPDALDPGEKESIDLVLDAYGGYSANELSQMTHNEKPWTCARRRADVSAMQRSDERLLDGDIFEFFDAMATTSGEDE